MNSNEEYYRELEEEKERAAVKAQRAKLRHKKKTIKTQFTELHEKKLRNHDNSKTLQDYIVKLEKENKALRDLIKENTTLKTNANINDSLEIFENALEPQHNDNSSLLINNRIGGKKTKKYKKSRKIRKSKGSKRSKR